MSGFAGLLVPKLAEESLAGDPGVGDTGASVGDAGGPSATTDFVGDGNDAILDCFSTSSLGFSSACLAKVTNSVYDIAPSPLVSRNWSSSCSSSELRKCLNPAR